MRQVSMIFVGIFLSLSISFSFFLDSIIIFKKPTSEDYQTTITFKGKIKTTSSAKVLLNGKQTQITIVNGKMPEEIIVGIEEGKIIFYNFIFQDEISYNKKYEYVHSQPGIPIIDGEIQYQFKTEVYKLKIE